MILKSMLRIVPQNYTALNTESTHIDGIQQNLTSIPVSTSSLNNNPETLTENNGLNDNSVINAESEFWPTPQNYTPLNNESNEYTSLSINHEKFQEASDTPISNLYTLRKTETNTLKNMTTNTNESGTESEDDDDSVKDPNFKSSSSSSRSSSDSSSSSSSSSDEEIGREVLREIVATRNTEELPEDLENNAANRKKSRKRMRIENEWNKNKIKRLRNAGKEYISSAKSKRVVAAKQVKEPCGEKCQHQCSKKFDREQRSQLFNAYYSLENIDRKRDFLSKHMELITPKYRYVRAASNRRLNFAFYFKTSEGKKLRVCKKFFKNTLDINDRTVLTVRDKTLLSGIVSADGRGKHKNHKKISVNLKNDVREHIQSIPRIESHYLRAQTSREFIDGSKTIAPTSIETTNLHDQCSLCFQYNTADEKGKENLKLQYDEHLKEKVLSRKDKEEDKAKVARALKSGPIFVPDQFVMLIRVAKKKGSPYFVKELSHDDFVHVKQLMADTGINFNVNTKGEQVFISNLRIVRVEKNQPFLFFYKMSYTESEEWKSVDVRGNAIVKKTTRCSESASTRFNILPTLKKAYKSKLTINENKKKRFEISIGKKIYTKLL
ncbi:unnamed protein product [Psylliodes chrysocephalus]|uniref:Uncharacterized protein n=1 Tax=Psylliodes chrysocephalus TaxID=3402493 RepID=A0A9P0CPM2_9CUCU|nr:unnamed protein product [Psylliodes chrysocephala]